MKWLKSVNLLCTREIKLLKNKQNEIASKHQNEITELESEISILRNESK
ncbi:hypothetical protein [Mycoplasmopsis bovis]